jgi:hypothetical protein
MKKAMSDLEARILKLEKSQSISPQQSPPIIPKLPSTPNNQKNSSSSHISKRSCIANTSSDDSDTHEPVLINVQLQATINKQNSIIVTQQEQLNIMITQLKSLTEKLSQQ